MNATRRTGPSADADPLDDPIGDDIDNPIGEWSLDEFGDDGDIASLRSAWTTTDGFDD